jgi:hypothetical protein
VFANERDLGLSPFWPALRAFGITRADLAEEAIVLKAC